ncbi:MAG: hypothetical protein KF862_22735 [Chitinophagaceae bacterium]|nr:hypothetical protein [Chitinophagaceae bacterium]
MKNTLTAKDIKARIALLEEQTQVMEDNLRDKAREVYDSFKPLNILKNTFSTISSSPGLKKDIFSTALNLGLGYLGTRFLMGKGGLAKKAAGAALQLGAGNGIARKLTVWKKFITGFFSKDKKAA